MGKGMGIVSFMPWVRAGPAFSHHQRRHALLAYGEGLFTHRSGQGKREERYGFNRTLQELTKYFVPSIFKGLRI